MKKNGIKKEYYLIAILLILFIFLTILVVFGKIDLIDEMFFNKIIKISLRNSNYCFTFCNSVTIFKKKGFFRF